MKVAPLTGAFHATTQVDQNLYRRASDALVRRNLLGRRLSGIRREGYAKGSQGVRRPLPHRRRRIEAAQIHHRPYGRVTLHQARVAAQKVFAAKLEGRDLAAEKREARRRIAADRVEDLLE